MSRGGLGRTGAPGFIVLVYGFACLLFGLSAKNLVPDERIVLIWFTAIFPLVVLLAFIWLVSKHPDKLYGPRDFRDDKSFLETLNQKRQTSKAMEPENKINIEELMKYGEEFSEIKKQEEKIKADLVVKKLDYSGQTAEVLIRHLAASQLLHFFDNTYHTLFGSQIKLLQLLNDPDGLDELSAQNYFDLVKGANPPLATWDLNGYLKFLFSSNLITKKGNQYQITDLGKEFLIWLAKSGNTENRAL